MKFIALASALFFGGCASFNVSPPGTGWRPENAERIAAFLAQSKAVPKKERRVAAFDWDNTMMKNDVGDATLFWMLNHDLILRPEAWAKTSRWLTADALQALEKTCAGGPAGTPLRTTENLACADTILEIYGDGVLGPEKKMAWKQGFNKDTTEPAYAWLTSLLAGHSEETVRKIAEDALDWNLSNPVGSTQKIGTQNDTAYVRIYGPMKELVRSLREADFDVWVVSASPQSIVETIARKVDIAPDHVIGVRSQHDASGKLTTGFQGCGPYAEGNQELITYRQGKRCWLNKITFGVKNPKEQMSKRSPTSLAAGDSDTDSFFVKDAHELRIVINRQKPELMCNAYANIDGKWLVNPMFIEPKSKKAGNYSCAQFGLPDQEDRVY